MLDQTLDTAQTFSQREQVTALQHPTRVSHGAAQHCGHDSTKSSGHLTPCERMLRIAFQARVVDALDLRMPFQELRNRQCVGAMSLHAQRQGLYSPQDLKTIERPGYRAHRILQVRQAILQCAVISHRRHAANRVRMPVEILRGGMDDYIDAE